MGQGVASYKCTLSPQYLVNGTVNFTLSNVQRTSGSVPPGAKIKSNTRGSAGDANTHITMPSYNATYTTTGSRTFRLYTKADRSENNYAFGFEAQNRRYKYKGSDDAYLAGLTTHTAASTFFPNGCTLYGQLSSSGFYYTDSMVYISLAYTYPELTWSGNVEIFQRGSDVIMQFYDMAVGKDGASTDKVGYYAKYMSEDGFMVSTNVYNKTGPFYIVQDAFPGKPGQPAEIIFCATYAGITLEVKKTFVFQGPSVYWPDADGVHELYFDKSYLPNGDQDYDNMKITWPRAYGYYGDDKPQTLEYGTPSHLIQPYVDDASYVKNDIVIYGDWKKQCVVDKATQNAFVESQWKQLPVYVEGDIVIMDDDYYILDEGYQIEDYSQPFRPWQWIKIEEFDDEGEYGAGEYVIYNNLLSRFKTARAPDEDPEPHLTIYAHIAYRLYRTVSDTAGAEEFLEEVVGSPGTVTQRPQKDYYYYLDVVYMDNTGKQLAKYTMQVDEWVYYQASDIVKVWSGTEWIDCTMNVFFDGEFRECNVFACLNDEFKPCSH